jgi:transposase
VKSGTPSACFGAEGKQVTGKLRKSTPQERREAVEAWKKSGLSQAMFAKQWGVNPITFSGWVAMAGAKRPGERRSRKASLAEPVKQEVVSVKRRFPTFGCQRIRDVLRRFAGYSVSTGSVRKVLDAEGLKPVPVVRRRRRKKSPGPPQEIERAHPNELWRSDITYVDVPWTQQNRTRGGTHPMTLDGGGHIRGGGRRRRGGGRRGGGGRAP